MPTSNERVPVETQLVTMTKAEFNLAINTARLAVLRLAKAAIASEHLAGETHEPDDKAYDRAVSDCENAVQRLIENETAPPKPANQAQGNPEAVQNPPLTF